MNENFHFKKPSLFWSCSYRFSLQFTIFPYVQVNFSPCKYRLTTTCPMWVLYLSESQQVMIHLYFAIGGWTWYLMRYALHVVLFVYALSPRASLSWTGKDYIINLGNPVLAFAVSIWIVFSVTKIEWERFFTLNTLSNQKSVEDSFLNVKATKLSEFQKKITLKTNNKAIPN